MIRLLDVEVRRLVARRAFRGLVLVFIGALCLVGGAAVKDANPVDPRAAEVFRQAREQTYDQELQQFRKLQASGQELPPDAREVSREEYVEGDEFYGGRSAPPDVGFDFVQSGPEVGYIIGGMLSVFAFVVGATAIGAEWQSGTMQALLFWEPRRVRVIVGKLGALVITVALVGLVGSAVLTALATWAGSRGGTLDQADADIWRELVINSARGIGLGAVVASLGFGIAGFTRATGAALGVGFVYFAILENVLRARVRWTNPYLIGNNIGAWLTGDLEVQTSDTKVVLMDHLHGGIVLAIYVAVITGVLTFLFVRRDVT